MTTSTLYVGRAANDLVRQQRLRTALHVLRALGWEERLSPLAQHMAAKHLVRARGEDGAPLRRLDLGTLRDALSTLLRDEDDDGYLVYQLVVEGADPALVGREHGVSRAELVDLLRDAVDAVAVAYEDTANSYLAEGPAVGPLGAAALGRTGVK